MMNNKIIGIATLIVWVFVIVPVYAVPYAADNSPASAPYKNWSKGNALYLFEKDENLDFVRGEAWGKLNLKNGIFNGHGLEPNMEYSLVVDPDWSFNTAILSSGATGKNGNIHLSFDKEIPNGKIWLVLSSDIYESGILSNWRPSEYLFEYNNLHSEDHNTLEEHLKIKTK